MIETPVTPYIWQKNSPNLLLFPLVMFFLLVGPMSLLLLRRNLDLFPGHKKKLC